MPTPTYQLTPIGSIQTTDDGARLVIDAPFRPALTGLDGFSHLLVVWWCHFADGEPYRSTLTYDQPYRSGPARLGVFATRGPLRPNPIAITPVAVRALDEQQGVIVVPFIDAEDGSPILDLKPYQPCADRLRDVQVPTWCRHWPQWYEDSATFDWAAEFVHAR